MKCALHVLAAVVIVLGLSSCAAAGPAPSSSVTFGFIHNGVDAVTGEGLSLSAEILDPEGALLGRIEYDVATHVTLSGAAQGFSKALRDRLGVGSRIAATGEESDAPIVLTLEGGYRFGSVTQRRYRAAAIYARGGILRVRRTSN